MDEIWRVVPEYPRYEASNCGRIRSAITGKSVNARKNSKGYLYVGLTNEDGRRGASVHSLVLMAFAGPRPKGYHGCHNDGDKRNNVPTNLRWDTPLGNHLDSVKHGTFVRGEDRPHSKLTAAEIREIRSSPLSSYYLGRKFGVSQKAISLVIQNKTWTHIEGGVLDELIALRERAVAAEATRDTVTKERDDLARNEAVRLADLNMLDKTLAFLGIEDTHEEPVEVIQRIVADRDQAQQEADSQMYRAQAAEAARDEALTGAKIMESDAAIHRARAADLEGERDEARAALARIESWEPVTQDVTLAHQMAAEARAALPENWSSPPKPETDIQRIVGEHADALRRLADK